MACLHGEIELARHHKSEPLYVQIYEDIRAKAERQELSPGDSLPTEFELAEIYGVSRVTIRKALDRLIREGIVQREHSKGARIADIKPQRNISRLTSLKSEILASGMVPSSVFSGIQRMEAGPVAAALGVSEQEPVIFFHRLRLANGIPIAVQEVYIREKYCSLSDVKRLGNDSLFDRIERQFGPIIDHAEQVLSARMPTKKQCAELAVESGEPLLFMKRTTYLKDGETLEYTENHYVAGRYEWSARSYRDHGES